MRIRSGELWRWYYGLGATPGILVPRLYGPERKRDTFDQALAVDVPTVDAAYTRLAGVGAAIRPSGGGVWYIQSNESGSDSSEATQWTAGTIDGRFAQSVECAVTIVSYAGAGQCDVGIYLGASAVSGSQRAYLIVRGDGTVRSQDVIDGPTDIIAGAGSAPFARTLKIVVGIDGKAYYFVDGAFRRASTAALPFTYGTHHFSGVRANVAAASVSRSQWDNLLIRGTSE